MAPGIAMEKGLFESNQSESKGSGGGGVWWWYIGEALLIVCHEISLSFSWDVSNPDGFVHLNYHCPFITIRARCCRVVDDGRRIKTTKHWSIFVCMCLYLLSLSFEFILRVHKSVLMMKYGCFESGFGIRDNASSISYGMDLRSTVVTTVCMYMGYHKNSECAYRKGHEHFVLVPGAFFSDDA